MRQQRVSKVLLGQCHLKVRCLAKTYHARVAASQYADTLTALFDELQCRLQIRIIRDHDCEVEGVGPHVDKCADTAIAGNLWHAFALPPKFSKVGAELRFNEGLRAQVRILAYLLAGIGWRARYPGRKVFDGNDLVMKSLMSQRDQCEPFDVYPAERRGLEPVIEVKAIDVDGGPRGYGFDSVRWRHKRLGPLVGPRRLQIEMCRGIADYYPHSRPQCNSYPCYARHSRHASRAGEAE